MGDADHGEPSPLQRIENSALGCVVESTRGFIKQQDAGATQERTTQLQSLAFTTTEISAVITQMPEEGLWMGCDRLQYLGICSSLLKIIKAVAGTPQGEVVLHAGIENKNLLRHIGQTATHQGISMLLPRQTIEEQFTSAWLIEPCK